MLLNEIQKAAILNAIFSGPDGSRLDRGDIKPLVEVNDAGTVGEFYLTGEDGNKLAYVGRVTSGPELSNLAGAVGVYVSQIYEGV